MYLRRLSLNGFRNLQAGSYSFESRVTAVSGRNGQGKTSFLEAIYLLAHSRSFRTSKNKELIAWGAEDSGARIEAEIETENGKQELLVTLFPRRREVLLNGKKVDSVLGFYGQVRVVIFTPEELQLVKGPPQQRRNFLDRTLAMIDEVFVKNALHYQRALKNRNALLAANRSVDELQIWDRLLVEHGRVIAEKRRKISSYIAQECVRSYGEISQESVEIEKVRMEYESDYLEAGELRAPEILLEEYAASWERDLRRGTTSLGVHRDDLLLELDTGQGRHDARSTASQGQARTFALALKLASLEYLRTQTSEEPILLLDDVESELDEPRKHALYRVLQASKSQVFLTGTQQLSGAKFSSAELSFLQMTGGILAA